MALGGLTETEGEAPKVGGRGVAAGPGPIYLTLAGSNAQGTRKDFRWQVLSDA